MTSPRDIIADYERREAEAGGYAKADIPALIRATAEHFGETFDTVTDVLRQHWAGSMGAG